MTLYSHSQLCCVIVKQGVCTMDELHDKYIFVNTSNLNLNKSDLNICVMLGFVLFWFLFVLLVTSPIAEEIAGRDNIYVLLMCFQLHGILSHCKGLELLCEMCLLCWELNWILCTGMSTGLIYHIPLINFFQHFHYSIIPGKINNCTA